MRMPRHYTIIRIFGLKFTGLNLHQNSRSSVSQTSLTEYEPIEQWSSSFFERGTLFRAELCHGTAILNLFDMSLKLGEKCQKNLNRTN